MGYTYGALIPVVLIVLLSKLIGSSLCYQPDPIKLLEFREEERIAMVGSQESNDQSIIARAIAIIISPAKEWPKIKAEDTSTREVFMRYVLPLALIGPVAGLIGYLIFGYSALGGVSFRPGLISAVIGAVVALALALISFLVLWLIADTLSRKFGGEVSPTNALKLVAYGSTPVWLVGIFALVPPLSILGLLALYSLYLIYVGVTPMLNVPKEKALLFTAVFVLCGILLNLAVAALSAANMKLLSGMGLFG